MKELPGFRIQQLLGRGATAQVFQAVRESDSRPVALKIFHSEVWEEKDLKRRVLKEAQVIAALKHPNIIQILETHFDIDPPALVMELIDGFSLEAFQPRLPYILPEISVLVVLEVLKALEHSHNSGVIHRDLKPANILVDRHGRVCVADFGLAKSTNLSQATLTGTVLGSPDFMSPEQATGDVVTGRSDIFSLSAVLYFLVTGTRPFARNNPLSTLAAVSRVEIDPVQRRNPKLGPELARIIHRGLARDASERFTSAKDYAEALSEYLFQLGLDLETFTLAAWIESPTHVTAEALKTIADALSHRCENQILTAQWNSAMETLSHLGQVAPESGAIPRLLGLLETEQAKTKKKTLFKRAALGIAAVLGVTVAIASIVRNPQISKPNETVQNAFRSPETASSGIMKPYSVTLAAAPVTKAAQTPRSQPNFAGTVRFELPAGVRVIWDGNEIDATAVLGGVRPGDHSIEMLRDGGKSITGTVQVKANEPTVIKAR